MEPLFHLLPLLILPSNSQASPGHPVTLPGGIWVWGQVGDQPKSATAGTAATTAAAVTSTAAATRAAEAVTASVVLPDGRWSWGAVDTDVDTLEKSKNSVEVF